MSKRLFHPPEQSAAQAKVLLDMNISSEIVDIRKVG
jgi:hypothetical protein